MNRLDADGSAKDGRVFGVVSPLRICPLGAHVDHQGGVVTGLTIDRCVSLAAVPTAEPRVEASSLDFAGDVSLDLREEVRGKCGDWGDYLRAAVSVLASAHHLTSGLRAVIAGDLPGAGLSSSAAVLVAYLFAVARANGIDLDREEAAALVQRAENEFVGVASGRLDQSIILFAEKECLTRVDCSSLRVEQVPRPRELGAFRVLVAYSGIRRALAGSGFNRRVDECREAAALLLELAGEAPGDRPVLSDVSPEVFERFGSNLSQVLRRRAAHYFSEQRRVANGVEAWRQGDLRRFGELMNASGASSIHNYECATAEIVTLYELLRDQPGVLGTRFSGGGFGGSCIALIEPGTDESIIDAVMREYRVAHPEAAASASFHVCEPGGRAELVDEERA